MTVTPIYKFNDDRVVEALEATRCNFAQAAAFLAKKWQTPCGRDYVSHAVKTRPRLAEYVHEYREAVADRAEANLFQAVDNGDYQASVLVVRTLGKNRGWVPRAEREGKFDADALIEAIRRGRERALANQRAVTIPEGNIEQRGDAMIQE